METIGTLSVLHMTPLITTPTKSKSSLCGIDEMRATPTPRWERLCVLVDSA